MDLWVATAERTLEIVGDLLIFTAGEVGPYSSARRVEPLAQRCAIPLERQGAQLVYFFAGQDGNFQTQAQLLARALNLSGSAPDRVDAMAVVIGLSPILTAPEVTPEGKRVTVAPVFQPAWLDVIREAAQAIHAQAATEVRDAVREGGRARHSPASRKEYQRPL